MSFKLLLFSSALVAAVRADQPCYDESRDYNGSPVQGWCEHTACCAGEYVISNLCPDYPAQVKCCFSYNSCSRNEGCEYSCSQTVQDLACEILEMYENNQIWLKPEHFNSQGNNPYDGASSLSNIRDTCLGRAAKRSAYGVAPGGCVCLSSSMLTTMRDYAKQFYSKYGQEIQINAIAGSEHSANSWHYQGNTMDTACTTPLYHCGDLEDYCRARGAIELCYPGSACGGHETWVHCAMPLD